jgi:hypothetical protein
MECRFFFGSLIADPGQIIPGTHIALAISVVVLLLTCAIELIGMARNGNEH